MLAARLGRDVGVAVVGHSAVDSASSDHSGVKGNINRQGAALQRGGRGQRVGSVEAAGGNYDIGTGLWRVEGDVSIGESNNVGKMNSGFDLLREVGGRLTLNNPVDNDLPQQIVYTGRDGVNLDFYKAQYQTISLKTSPPNGPITFIGLESVLGGLNYDLGGQTPSFVGTLYLVEQYYNYPPFPSMDTLYMYCKLGKNDMTIRSAAELHVVGAFSFDGFGIGITPLVMRVLDAHPVEIWDQVNVGVGPTAVTDLFSVNIPHDTQAGGFGYSTLSRWNMTMGDPTNHSHPSKVVVKGGRDDTLVPKVFYGPMSITLSEVISLTSYNATVLGGGAAAMRCEEVIIANNTPLQALRLPCTTAGTVSFIQNAHLTIVPAFTSTDTLVIENSAGAQEIPVGTTDVKKSLRLVNPTSGMLGHLTAASNGLAVSVACSPSCDVNFGGVTLFTSVELNQVRWMGGAVTQVHGMGSAVSKFNVTSFSWTGASWPFAGAQVYGDFSEIVVDVSSNMTQGANGGISFTIPTGQKANTAIVTISPSRLEVIKIGFTDVSAAMTKQCASCESVRSTCRPLAAWGINDTGPSANAEACVP